MSWNIGSVQVSNRGSSIGVAIVVNLLPSDEDKAQFNDVHSHFTRTLVEKGLAEALDASEEVKAFRAVAKRVADLEKTKAGLDRQIQRNTLDRADALANLDGDKLVSRLTALANDKVALEQKLAAYHSAATALGAERDAAKEFAEVTVQRLARNVALGCGGAANDRLVNLRAKLCNALEDFLNSYCAADHAALHLRDVGPVEQKAARMLAARIASGK